MWVLPPRARGYSRKTDLKPVMKDVNGNRHSCYLEVCGVRDSEPGRGFGGAFLASVSCRLPAVITSGGVAAGVAGVQLRGCRRCCDAGRSDEGGRSPRGESRRALGRICWAQGSPGACPALWAAAAETGGAARRLRGAGMCVSSRRAEVVLCGVCKRVNVGCSASRRSGECSFFVPHPGVTVSARQ